ncbi:tetratricopeptide repeat protein [Azospirillum halopraeferens]|uniref:tetratricopeptide repeat protein n=1 Tax=Azospirillum halopraeferens TaxID=34010 RepID=UPI00042A499C|nr:tetratricopeptide repeat protein [Azospirillum halopraeferens]
MTAGRLLARAVERHRAGDLAEAERLYRQIPAAGPEHTEALHLLGVLAHQTGHHDAALRLIGQSLDRDAGRAEVHANHGLVLHALGRVAEAEAAYRRALALRESYPEAHNSLGSALQEQGRPAEAQAHYRRALDLRPAYPEALVNLATLLRDADRVVPAEAALRRAVALAPDDAAALDTLGVILTETGRAAAAEAVHRRALCLAPGDPEALVNLGLALRALGRTGEAEACYRHALAHAPGDALARWNLALLLIGRGDLAEGRELYEARFESRRVAGGRDPGVPRWQGEDASALRLLVWREQGIGDELLYGTCLPDLAAVAGHVVLEVDRRLVGLFARSFPRVTVRADSVDGAGRETVVPADADRHVPMASLPRFLRRRYADFPPRTDYLVPDPRRVELWRDRLAACGPGLRVGVCWRSGRTHGERKAQYTTLDQWAPLWALPGITFVALQYDARDDEVAGVADRFGVRLHRWPDTDLKEDLETAAALTACLDLVITVQSSVGEMAGALGVPVWRFSAGPDWTMQGTGCRPWFPSMRMWSPGAAGAGLDGVLHAMAAELRRLRDAADPFAALAAAADRLLDAGRGPEAEPLYQRVLAARQEHPAALHGYGRLAAAAGRPDIGAHLIARAIAAGGGTAARHRDHARALHALGAAAEAAEAYGAALAIDPADPESRGARGVLLLTLGRAAEAEAALAGAAAQAADWAGLHANRALALHALGRHADAAAALRRALALDPALAEAWNTLASLRPGEDAAAAARCAGRALCVRPAYAEAYGNLGLALAAQGRAEAAVECHRAAVRLRDDPAALANLALALEAAGQGDAAGLAWWRLLLADPGAPAGWAGLADLRQRQGRGEAAVRAWRRALVLAPQRAEWHYNHANALHALGRPDAADAAYRRAAEADPALALARFNRGYAALARGDAVAGWTGLEARFAAGRAHPDRRFRRPAWDGGDLAGRTVLVWREQGVGDELMYASCYPDLIARAGRVIVECDPRLVPLFARSFPRATVRAATDDPDDMDVHVPAASLPLHHRRTLAAFPPRAGWLRADPAAVAAWRDRPLAAGPGLRVGLCWRSRFRDARRSAGYTGLAAWAPLFAVPGVHPVILQYDDCAAEVAEAEARFGVRLHRPAGLDLLNDLDGAAALTASLDLVVSAGTSVAEMAGALGVPVWRIGAAGEWTALGTAVRPWYPSMRLFAPRPGESMDDLPGRIAAALRRECP